MQNNSKLNLAYKILTQLVSQFTYNSNSNLVENNAFLGLFLITCHIFEKYNLNTFMDYNLDKITAKLLKQATKRKYTFLNLSANEVLGLVDVWYVAEQRNIKTFNIESLKSLYLKQYSYDLHRGELMYSWLIKEITNLLKTKTNEIDKHFRPYKNKNKIYDLYWLTHLIFLETNYFNKTLDYRKFSLEITELLGACNSLVFTKNLDLGAEVAICLDLAKKSHTKEYNNLINLLLDNADQLFNYQPLSMEFDALHTSSVAMVAIAGFTKNLVSVKLP